MTDSYISGSSVNFVLSQSHEQPSFFSCCKITPPNSSVHSQACFKNSSRVRSFLSIPCSLSRATTLASVAIDAWSVPGTQQAFNPFILARRMSISCKELFNICPIWSTPVTFGGGITMEYDSRLSGVEAK